MNGKPDIIEKNYGDHKDLIIECPWCGKTSTIKLNVENTKAFDEGVKAYQNGALIQNAFPFLTAGERELLMTGICTKCWESM